MVALVKGTGAFCKKRANFFKINRVLHFIDQSLTQAVVTLKNT